MVVVVLGVVVALQLGIVVLSLATTVAFLFRCLANNRPVNTVLSSSTKSAMASRIPASILPSLYFSDAAAARAAAEVPFFLPREEEEEEEEDAASSMLRASSLRRWRNVSSRDSDVSAARNTSSLSASGHRDVHILTPRGNLESISSSFETPERTADSCEYSWS